jgi:hypothetical protein
MQSGTYGTVQSGTYGTVQSGTYGTVQSGTYGTVQYGTYGTVQSGTRVIVLDATAHHHVPGQDTINSTSIPFLSFVLSTQKQKDFDNSSLLSLYKSSQCPCNIRNYVPNPDDLHLQQHHWHKLKS